MRLSDSSCTAPAASAIPVNESEGDESEDDESEILEESPCGRWLKRREVVSYRDRDRVWEELEEREALEGGWWEEEEDPMSEGEEEFTITGCRRANSDG